MKYIVPKKINGHKKQEAVWNDKHRFIDILAGRRGGKDWISARLFVKRILIDLKSGKGEAYWSMKQGLPRLLYWAVAPTYKIGQVQKKELLRVLGPMGLLLKDDRSKSQLWVKGGVLIELKSAENPNNLVGEGLDGLYVTETSRLKANVWNDNLRPTLSDKDGWGIFATTPLGDNWYITEIREVAEHGPKHDDEWSAHFWHTAENDRVPSLKKEVEKARKTMPLKYFRRNYEASRDSFQGQVFDDFDYNVHVHDWEIKPESYKVIIGGLDWGWNHPTVMILIGITDDGVVDVIYERGESKVPVISDDEKDDTWISRAIELNKCYNVEMYYAGVDRPENIDAMARYVPVDKADNAVNSGIEYISTLLHVTDGYSRMRIHASCTGIISEMRKYRWKEKKDGNDSEEPQKENDDYVDALRYAIYSASHWIDLKITE